MEREIYAMPTLQTPQIPLTGALLVENHVIVA